MIGTTRWRPLITAVAAEYPPLDPVVFEAMVLTESNGNPEAKSASDARGLTQIIHRWHTALIDETARRFGVPPEPDALYDPRVSLYAGGRYLRWLYQDDDPGKRSWERAVRAYFSGSYEPADSFQDGQGTSADQHITKLRAALVTVQADMAGSEPTKQEEPMAKTIAMPEADRQIATRKVNGIGMNLLGPRTLRGICFHRAYSGNQTLQNAADWLKRPDTRGLTDLFCDHRTGKMIRTNEITGTSKDMTGWAQGPYNAGAASNDGRAFRDTFGPLGKGVNVVNSDLESIEVTGNYDSPISESCKAALVQWAASRAQKLGCTSASFPIIPKTGLTAIYGHIEFCGKGHKICPGPVVWAFITGELITRVRAMLKDAEEGAVVTPIPPKPDAPESAWAYPDPVMPAFWADLQSGKPYVIHNGTVWYPDNTEYVVKQSTKRQQYAVADDRVVGPDLPVGTTFRGGAKGQSDSDKRFYTITPTGTRVNLDALAVLEDVAA